MRYLYVAAAVLNQTPLDWDGNKLRIVAAIQAARKKGVGLICLPELCISGYGCEDAFHSMSVLAESQRVLLEILPETRGLVVSVGLPMLYHKTLFNTAALIADGQILGFVAKHYLSGDGIHYEPRWFKPWPMGHRALVEVGGSPYPLGDLCFDVGGVRIGFEICEDAWVATRPGAALARAGVDLILNPSASHFAFGKAKVRRRFVLEGSRAFAVAYVYANLLGNESGRAIYDGDALIASGGTMMAEGPRLGFEEWGITTAVVDLDSNRVAQARIVSFRPDVEEVVLVSRKHSWPPTPSPARRPDRADWEQGPDLKAEEFTRALTLGLFDYLRKSRSRGFVVSLSGGADSGAVACLIGMMVRRAWEQLGAGGFKDRLGYFSDLRDCANARDATTRLLTTVYQASPNSSELTRQAARVVAEALGARHHEMNIGPLIEAYTRLASEAIGRDLDWVADDLALQNIQARVRAPGVWFLANIEGKLLVATSNRSEAAVGYATMDGDTCGGISPIAGIDKAYLRKWLVWLESRGPEGLGPIPALAAVTQQRSTPELRPREAKQVSEEDLMPFPVLDVIERWAILDKMGPAEVAERLFYEWSDSWEQIVEWVHRFFTLWSRNQWKRERYAPSFHLDDENLDPKTWCRFPILSGGFSHELHELRNMAAPDRRFISNTDRDLP